MLSMRTLAFATLVAAGSPTLAEAAPALSTANVNMRSGPSTGYPAVQVVPAGSRVEIFGCMQSANWCDVAYRGYRGWVSGSYLQANYSQRRVAVGPQYYRPLGIPSVTFSVGRYWDRHYRGRDFYRDRDRWSNNDRARPGRDDIRDNDGPREVRRDNDRRPGFDGRDRRGADCRPGQQWDRGGCR